ncbi:MAG: threonine--tRNA ligase [Patescibacteria group bacterium]|nr:threonine--tRNA ligase [Patescibacteria group bacterium]MDD4304354.1 threonine--tRNA ligase [Patescibacteria group bacterium]MDD4695377.1 threonine--tRNA ligase [Patescibacteria group bacterium]
MKETEINIKRHSLAHVMASAVLKLYPKAKFGVGPNIENGFYYDIDLGSTITEEDLGKIEREMQKIILSLVKFEREEMKLKDAVKLFTKLKQDYKIELLKDLEKKGTTKITEDEVLENVEKISIYKTGEFVDLCRGPHVENTKELKDCAFKLTKLAGAYWRGSEKNKMLTRIYGIAFESQQELDEYLKLLEEAERRDHRKLGRELDLFSFQEEAPGMPFFHAKGTIIWNKLVEFLTEKMYERNYEINKTPIILNKSLWLQSGHWDHYKNNMYFTKIDETDFAVKPMNCPGNILIYKAHQYSYRDLPLRAGEFGICHRHELSGVLSGLFRVRCFTQDDAHVFCTKEQMKDEIADLINLADEVYSAFGFSYNMELSTRPEKAMGDPELWELAENTLKDVLDATGKEYKLNEGDGAFYGPKIDFHLKDAIGRTWQCGTIQLDFQMPEKFNLTYEGPNNQKLQPVMIHRAILGSVERFLGILVENFAGAFPLWLSPVQVKIISVGESHIDHCKELANEFRKSGLRVEIDDTSETVGNKIRKSSHEKIPYVLVIGDKEINSPKLSVRVRGEKDLVEIEKDKFVKDMLEKIKNRDLNL